MKAKEYQVLLQAVEDGVSYGWMRAHKHVDDPTEGTIKGEIVDSVLNAICEWFDFDDNAAEGHCNCSSAQ